MTARPLTVLVCALGGEGGGVLASWLYEAAARAGHAAQATSIPGVAQRSGATTYYIEVQREPAGAGTALCVFSLSPVPGEVDLLVSSELLETVRQIGHGMASAERTRLVSATGRALTVDERIVPGDGRVDTAALEAVARRHAREATLLDFTALAREAGTVASAVMLGAIAGTGVLPIPRRAYEEAIETSGRGVQASLRGFAAGFDAVANAPAPSSAGSAAPTVAAAAPAARAAPAASAASADLRALARARLVAYQDEAYAALYDERLARIVAAETAAASAGGAQPGSAAAAAGGAVTEEIARWLALWMAYDDIVRVAALKLARSRIARVRREVGARDDEIVRVYDHFKPGAAEVAALLPAALAARVLAWDRRRVERGGEPWGLPLRLATHGFAGALALRLLAGLKRWRRRGSRYALEQQLIERWLEAVERGTREHAALGLELARCGRLVKGYGSTNERGKENLLHVLDHLAFGTAGDAAARAAAVRAAREAALADGAGRALDAALVAHGAPARPPREQVVRWVKRRPGSAEVSGKA